VSAPLALPLRVEHASPPMDMHFVMENGNERYAVAFGTEPAKLEAIVRACNNFDALVAALTESLEYFEDREDVIDGSYGEPAPNKEMALAQMIRSVLPKEQP
jgi:hypothetical protein